MENNNEIEFDFNKFKKGTPEKKDEFNPDLDEYGESILKNHANTQDMLDENYTEYGDEPQNNSFDDFYDDDQNIEKQSHYNNNNSNNPNYYNRDNNYDPDKRNSFADFKRDMKEKIDPIKGSEYEANSSNLNDEKLANFLTRLSEDRAREILKNRFKGSNRMVELQNCLASNLAMSSGTTKSVYTHNSLGNCFEKDIQAGQKNIEKINQMEKQIGDAKMIAPFTIFLIILLELIKSRDKYLDTKHKLLQQRDTFEIMRFQNLSEEEKEKYISNWTEKMQGFDEKVFDGEKIDPMTQKKYYTGVDDYLKENEKEIEENLNTAIKIATDDEHETIESLFNSNYLNEELNAEQIEVLNKRGQAIYNKKAEDKIKEINIKKENIINYNLEIEDLEKEINFSFEARFENYEYENELKDFAEFVEFKNHEDLEEVDVKMFLKAHESTIKDSENFLNNYKDFIEEKSIQEKLKKITANKNSIQSENRDIALLEDAEASHKYREKILNAETPLSNADRLALESTDSLYVLYSKNKQDLDRTMENLYELSKNNLKEMTSPERIDESNNLIMKQIKQDSILNTSEKKETIENIISEELNKFHTKLANQGQMDFLSLKNSINSRLDEENIKILQDGEEKELNVGNRVIDLIDRERLERNNEGRNYICNDYSKINNCLDSIKEAKDYFNKVRFSGGFTNEAIDDIVRGKNERLELRKIVDDIRKNKKDDKDLDIKSEILKRDISESLKEKIQKLNNRKTKLLNDLGNSSEEKISTYEEFFKRLKGGKTELLTTIAELSPMNGKKIKECKDFMDKVFNFKYTKLDGGSDPVGIRHISKMLPARLNILKAHFSEKLVAKDRTENTILSKGGDIGENSKKEYNKNSVDSIKNFLIKTATNPKKAIISYVVSGGNSSIFVQKLGSFFSNESHNRTANLFFKSGSDLANISETILKNKKFLFRNLINGEVVDAFQNLHMKSTKITSILKDFSQGKDRNFEILKNSLNNIKDNSLKVILKNNDITLNNFVYSSGVSAKKTIDFLRTIKKNTPTRNDIGEKTKPIAGKVTQFITSKANESNVIKSFTSTFETLRKAGDILDKPISDLKKMSADEIISIAKTAVVNPKAAAVKVAKIVAEKSLNPNKNSKPKL